jgi:RHS repeat-associated protein
MVVSTSDYDPYGVVSSHIGTSNSDFGYASAWTDPITDLDYLRAREYDPRTAQFLQIDSALEQTRQPYAYTRGNPLNAWDPSGRTYCLASGYPCVGDSATPSRPSQFDQCIEMETEQLEGLAYLQAADWQRALWPFVHFTSDVEQSTGPLIGLGWGLHVADSAASSESSRPDSARFFEVDSSGVATVKILTGDSTVVSVSEHAAGRMAQRNVNLGALQEALDQTPFKYWQKGGWQEGYYDADTKVFVGVRAGEVTTVIDDASSQYVDNVKARQK